MVGARKLDDRCDQSKEESVICKDYSYAIKPARSNALVFFLILALMRFGKTPSPLGRRPSAGIETCRYWGKYWGWYLVGDNKLYQA